MINSTLQEALASFSNVIERVAFSDAAGESISESHTFSQLRELFSKVKQERKTIYFIGNGGSAAIVAHVQNDLVNKCKLKCHVLQDASLLTCMSNDYGYQVAYSTILDTCFDEGDVLVAVSSSGNSANMLEASKVVKHKKGFLLTLTGFSEDNHLRKLGNINIWLPSKDYGEVEVGHQFILHLLTDRLALELN
ncbi:SIS domain-containing protein [Leeia sp. TBRC 13508]|uniref:SIS domain-containing protein n=1 Tax=Leeia speluncae TaxID=2884804 RepID=A0ABS8D225_9NEIS|nr:SIS domain-containing protein [Leeia speluncae]MCB6182230.1 SIS domain-containing protein [Leeia speluncae]